MPAYVVIDIEVTDAVKYEEFKKQAPVSVAKYGGRLLTAAGKTEPLEGGWDSKGMTLLEFPTAGRAREWYASDEYRPAKDLRQQIANARAVLVAGAQCRVDRGSRRRAR
ncbi:MAG: DUF1330 domain-containing protein [Chloroflexi bacterium]|nr:DUF1330 domain-containing protein [Chloroflexota bacterium]